MQNTGSYAVILLTAFSLAAGIASAQTADAGKYWVNISQTGADSYAIRLEVEAGEALEIRSVSIPGFVDPSEIPGRTEIRPLSTVTVSIPIHFTGTGEGSLWFAVQSAGAERSHYLVFHVFNTVPGSAAHDLVRSTARRWQSVSGVNSVVQLGSSPVPCGGELASQTESSDMFSAGKAVRGIILLGSAQELKGSVTGINPDGWGVRFMADKAGRVGSFFAVKDLAVESQARLLAESGRQREEPAGGQEEAGRPSGQQGTSTQTSGQNRPNPQNQPGTTPEKKTQPESRPQRPATGPFSGAGPARNIPGLSPRTDWAGGQGGAGHFGETAVSLPQEFSRLKTVERVELVLVIASRDGGSAMGRVMFSDRRTLSPSVGGNQGDYWFASRYEEMGTVLGQFNISGSEELRYDVTDAVKSGGGPYYISVLNLSRSVLDIRDIRLAVKGVR
jgi:hypothetical protein